MIEYWLAHPRADVLAILAIAAAIGFWGCFGSNRHARDARKPGLSTAWSIAAVGFAMFAGAMVFAIGLAIF